MAKFKNKDILVLQDEELLLGNAQEASIKYDGSDLVVNKVPYHSSEGYLATQQFVNDALLGLDWQNSVLSKTTDIPAGTEGDRYIIPSGASGAWSGLDDTIAEYTTTWVYTTPSAGFTLWVEDGGVYYTYNASWVKMGTVVDHSNLLNLGVDDHTQYLNTTRHDTFARHGTSSVDHGSIFGLGDDDHAQYLTTGRHDTTDRHGSAVVDHGSIGGLLDDDHTQYLPMSGGRAMTGDLDLDSYNLTTTGYVSAGTLYGDGTGLTVDHGLLDGLSDDDHIIYLHTDGRRPWTGTLTVASTGSQIQFTEDLAYIGVSSNTDLLTLSPTGVIVDGDVSATTFGGAGFDHDLITNTHDLTNDIDHDTITNTHDLTTDIDHNTITNNHNLTTDINHNTITNAHNLTVDIDHGSIGGLTDDDHPQYFLLSSSATVSGDILAATAGLDIGSVGTPFSDIYCDTLHTSAGSVIIGTVTLTDVAGELAVDATPVISLTTTQEASANALSQANDYTDTQIVGSGIVKGYDSVATSSGTSKDLTGISENAVQINVFWRNLSNNNSSYAPIIQLSNQSAPQATGHDGWVNAGASNDRNDTDGIHCFNKTSDHALTDIYDGHLIITRMSADGTIWAWQGNSLGDAETNDRSSAGYVVLTSAFGGTVRITSEAGGADFDGGTVYISYF